MSKPLATKVSTPLSENVQIGPKVSIFCVDTIFQHCLNPLWHGVHQSFTGCHWSPLPLLHDNITELVDVRDLIQIIGLVQRIVRFVMRTEPKASYRTVRYEYAYRYTHNIHTNSDFFLSRLYVMKVKSKSTSR